MAICRLNPNVSKLDQEREIEMVQLGDRWRCVEGRREGGGTCRCSEDFYYLLHLSTLKRNCLLVIHLNLLALEDRFQCKKFPKNASHSPHICITSVTSAQGLEIGGRRKSIELKAGVVIRNPVQDGEGNSGSIGGELPIAGV